MVAGDERECATGEEGELRLRGPQCFLGYVDAALDAAAFDADGWFRTGDLGIIDADGNVSVTGRIKDIIIRNAENISALEIEEALYQHPAVVDVAVVAAPDARTGERVCAFVVPAPDAPPPTITDLANHCRSLGLAVQKCPEQLELVDSLPHNSFGKVLKQDLKARLEPTATNGRPSRRAREGTDMSVEARLRRLGRRQPPVRGGRRVHPLPAEALRGRDPLRRRERARQARDPRQGQRDDPESHVRRDPDTGRVDRVLPRQQPGGQEPARARGSRSAARTSSGGPTCASGSWTSRASTAAWSSPRPRDCWKNT